MKKIVLRMKIVSALMVLILVAGFLPVNAGPNKVKADTLNENGIVSNFTSRVNAHPTTGTVADVADAAATDACGLIKTMELFQKVSSIPFTKELVAYVGTKFLEGFGYQSYETRVENKLDEINSKLDELTLLIEDLTKKIDESSQHVIDSQRIVAYANELTRLDSKIEGVYKTLLKINNVSSSYTSKQYEENLEYFAKLVFGVDKNNKLENVVGLGDTIEKTLNFGKMMLPTALYDTSIFEAARSYFEYPCVWAHEAYSNREKLRTSSLAVYEKSREVCEIALLYKLKLLGVTGIKYAPDGTILLYSYNNNLYANFTNEKEFLDASSEVDKKNSTDGDFVFNFYDENELTKLTSKSLLGMMEEFLEFSIQGEKLEYIPLEKNAVIPIEAELYINALTRLKQYNAQIIDYAKKDLKEMSDNSVYRIHLKLDPNAVTAFNRYNRPNYPKDTQKSERTETSFVHHIDSFLVYYNCKKYSIPGYQKAYVNEKFTSTDYDTLNTFIKYIPTEYFVKASNKTLYDYLTDTGFVFYKNATGEETVDKGIIGLSVVEFTPNKLSGYLKYFGVELQTKLYGFSGYTYTGNLWDGYTNNPNSIVEFSGGMRDADKSFGFLGLGSIVSYHTAYNNPFYNIGFPSAYRNDKEYENTEEYRLIQDMQRRKLRQLCMGANTSSDKFPGGDWKHNKVEV